ncbi:hypothetical protein CHLRE_06g276759v5 [Chlamydomonas reinhardtii]|uniref:Uncharacterized protein n=1 Tax=Chlamydomonas reinhardtii TaxID=3055 RepID=A0A2K3DNP8_CHLRE|nr:uncharacterized protein CHLRE_06g276759v5 [Chlamydomonas reinhardtii]PNW82166.1 hypothetical protein CHLRE_06g276759v5 [Chlamydomonas reinhardtii]
MPPRVNRVFTGSGSSCSTSQQQRQQAEASHEERVARVCALGCRVHQALLLQCQPLRQRASRDNSHGDAVSGSSNSAGRGSSQAATVAMNARGSGNRAGSGSRKTAAVVAAVAAGGGGGLPALQLPRAADLAAAAVDLVAIREVVLADPSRTTPDIFTEAHLCGRLQGLMALLGWCLRLAVPAQPPFIITASATSSDGGNSNGGVVTTHALPSTPSLSPPLPPQQPAAPARSALGTDDDALQAAAHDVTRELCSALFTYGVHGVATLSSDRGSSGGSGSGGDAGGGGGPPRLEKAHVVTLLARCRCIDVMCAALARCSQALEPALPLPPPPPALQLQLQRQEEQPPRPTPVAPQRRVRLGNSGWTVVWRWLDIAHDLLGCVDWCLNSYFERQAVVESLSDPAFGLKLLDCYSRTLLGASVAVAGGGGSGGGGATAPAALQQAGSLAQAMKNFTNRLSRHTRFLKNLAPQSTELLHVVAACPALSYALAAHAVHTCAAIDGGGAYGLRCGPVAAAVARAVAPPWFGGGGGSGCGGGSGGGVGSGSGAAAAADAGRRAADSDDDSELRGAGACSGALLPLLGPGSRMLQPPPGLRQLLQQQRRRHGGGGSGSSGGGNSRGASGSSSAATAATASIAAPPEQAAVAIDVRLAQSAAEVWRDSLAAGWQWLLAHPQRVKDGDADMPYSRLPPQEQLRLCQTQPSCLRAAYARASGPAEGQPQPQPQEQQQSAAATASGSGASGGPPCSAMAAAAAAAEELSRRLAAARSCPLLHCGVAFEVGMRLAAAAAGCMAQATATAPEHRQLLWGAQELALAAVAGRRTATATAASAAATARGECGLQAGFGAEEERWRGMPQLQRRRLELVGVSRTTLITTGLKLARAAWQDTSAVWLPRPDDIAVVNGSSTAGICGDGGGSSTDGAGSSTGISSGGHGGVPYPPAPVQRDLLSWWQAALGWAGLFDVDYGGAQEGSGSGGRGSGGGSGDGGDGGVGGGGWATSPRLSGPLAEGGASSEVSDAWFDCRGLLLLDTSGSTGMPADSSGIAGEAAARTVLPPLRLRPCPDVAAALVAGYLPVVGRLVRTSAFMDRFYPLEPLNYGFGTDAAKAAVWSQLLVFGPPAEARAFVQEVRDVARRRVELFRAAVTEAVGGAVARRHRRQKHQQGQQRAQQTGRQGQQPTGRGGSAAAMEGASRAAGAPPFDVPSAASLLWESMDLCVHGSSWCATGSLAKALLTSGLLLAPSTHGSSRSGSSASSNATATGSSTSSSTSTSSGSSSTSGPASSPLAGLQLGNEAAVAARVAAAARVVATQLLPAASTSLRAVAWGLNASQAAGSDAVPSAVAGHLWNRVKSPAAVLRWVPLLLRTAAAAAAAASGAPVEDVTFAAASPAAAAAAAAGAEGEEEWEVREQQQQQRAGTDGEGGWRRGECCCWERLLWCDINLPALLGALCDLVGHARDNSRETAAVPAAAAGPAAAAASAAASAKAGASQQAAIAAANSNEASERLRCRWVGAVGSLNSFVLPEVVRAMIALLQLAPLRLLQPAPSRSLLPPPEQQHVQQQQPAATVPAVGSAGQRGGAEGAAAGSAEGAATAAAAAAAAGGTVEKPDANLLCGVVDDDRTVRDINSSAPAAAVAPPPAGPLHMMGDGSEVAAPALNPHTPLATAQWVGGGSSTRDACRSSSSGSSGAAASQPAPATAAPAAASAATPNYADTADAVVDVRRICELLRVWGGGGDGPALSTHLAGVLESAAAGDWAAVRAKSRWLRFGGVVTHAPSDVAARLWRQQRQVMAHGAGHGVPVEVSVLDAALDAAAALLVGQRPQQQQKQQQQKQQKQQ